MQWHAPVLLILFSTHARYLQLLILMLVRLFYAVLRLLFCRSNVVDDDSLIDLVIVIKIYVRLRAVRNCVYLMFARSVLFCTYSLVSRYVYCFWYYCVFISTVFSYSYYSFSQYSLFCTWRVSHLIVYAFLHTIIIAFSVSNIYYSILIAWYHDNYLLPVICWCTPYYINAILIILS